MPNGPPHPHSFRGLPCAGTPICLLRVRRVVGVTAFEEPLLHKGREGLLREVRGLLASENARRCSGGPPMKAAKREDDLSQILGRRPAPQALDFLLELSRQRDPLRLCREPLRLPAGLPRFGLQPLRLSAPSAPVRSSCSARPRAGRATLGRAAC